MPHAGGAIASQRPDMAESFLEFPFAMATQGLIAAEVLPPIETLKQAGNYGVIPSEQLAKLPTGRRTNHAGYSRSTFEFDDAQFSCEEFGFEELVDDRSANMYSDYFNAELVAGLRARSFLLRAYEARVSAAVFNATTWTGSALTTAVTHEWDDEANATPRADVLAAKLRVLAGCGMWPDTLIINKKVLEALRDNAQVIDRLKAAGFTDPRPGKLTAQDIAAALGIEKIVVAGGVYDSALEGQSSVFAQLWSDEYAMVCKTASGNDFREPCIGRTFHWGGDGSVIGGQVETYREEGVRSDIVRVRHDVDEVMLYPQCGHLLSNITT